MRRTLAVILLMLPMNGCITAYRMGYQKASDECLDAVAQGTQIVQSRLTEQRKLDRLELDTCRDTLAVCNCK